MVGRIIRIGGRVRPRQSESGGGKKKKHARGEGGVPVSRPSRSVTTTTKKNHHTKKRSSDDMDHHTKTRDPVEEDTDDDVSTSSPPPQIMKKTKKRKDDEEDAEEQSDEDDESQETAEAETANDSCFHRQGNQGPPTSPAPDRLQIGGQSPNPQNQMDETTTLLHEELRRLQEENNKMKSQLSTTRQEAVQTARVTPAKNPNHGGEGVAALQRTADTLS
eukprot:scaffold1816_cov103-Cylindrotheca_fusiformis.AAC.2